MGVLDDLRARGHDIQIPPRIGYGGGQLIYKLDDGYCAASDPVWRWDIDRPLLRTGTGACPYG